MERDSYGRIAKWYDRVLEPMNGPLRPIGLKMYPPQPGMAVLDVGCGTGSYLAQYLEVGCRGFGIDSSPAMLEQAKQRLGQGTHRQTNRLAGVGIHSNQAPEALTAS